MPREFSTSLPLFRLIPELELTPMGGQGFTSLEQREDLLFGVNMRHPASVSSAKHIAFGDLGGSVALAVKPPAGLC